MLNYTHTSTRTRPLLPVSASALAETLTPHAIAALMHTFGTLISFLRQRSHVLQYEVVAALALFHCQFDRCTYARIERGRRAPRFDQLAALYKALVRSGVEIRSAERAAYLVLARKKIASKGSHRERIQAAE